MARSEKQKAEEKRRRKAKQLMKLPPGKFRQLTERETSEAPDWMDLVYKNNRFIVMVGTRQRTSAGTAILAMVQSHFNKPIQNHWRTLQDIKNEIFGDEVMAIEYYPPEKLLVDQENIYWLWIFPQGQIPIPELGQNQDKMVDCEKCGGSGYVDQKVGCPECLSTGSVRFS